MKKLWGTAAAVFVCLGMLSGCGNENVNEEISETFAKISLIVISDETVSEVSEAAETEITEIEITEETTVVSEMEQEPELPYEIVDMSNYTGNFYEWEYDYDIVAYDRESFSGGGDIINTAARTVREKFIYTIFGKDYTYGEIASLAEKAEKNEEYNGYVFEADGERLIIFNDIYERFSDENGKLEPSLLEGVCEDFDGDGKKESFLYFGMFDFAGSFSNTQCCVVFVNSEGNAELLPEASGEIFDWGEMLHPMRYNGFIHMCTAFGVNNSSHHSEIYAVENGKAVHKKSMFSPGDPFCGAFMLESAAQAPGSWISFWNEETKEYCTLAEDDVTEEEMRELMNSELFKQNEWLTGFEPEELRFGSAGKKFYSVFSKDGYGDYFERTDSGFEKFEYSIICPYYSNEAYVIGIDINKAQTEMIRLEK